MNLTTTLAEIKKHNPCVSGWKKLIEGLKTKDPDTEVTLKQILDINGVKDAYWALRCWGYREYCLLLADVAKSVLKIFEKKNSDDKRPCQAIEAIRKWYHCEISGEELKTYAAAAAAAGFAVRVPGAAAYAYAADAAAAAAYAADAAYADAAADAAAYAADAAADAAQWKKNEELIRKFIGE